jgi:hypothetical protein
LRSGAAHRGLEFDVTIEECWNLFLIQNGKCAISGIPLVLLAQRRPMRKQPESESGGVDGSGRIKRGSTKQTASLDRIDSTKGYVLNNIQWVHKTINRMKMDMTDSQFVEFCTIVANFQAAKE